MEDSARADHTAPVSRRLLIWTILRVTASLTLLFVAYSLLPGTEPTSGTREAIFAVVVVALVILIVLAIRSVSSAPRPVLRVVEVTPNLVAIFLIAFSVAYLGVSHSNGRAFSEPLDHISAFYFTLVTFATVGFGDIVAKTDAARLVVVVQIVLDLLFIGVVVRLLVGAVQRRLQRT